MQTHVSPRRDFQGLEQRRKQAGRLFAAGKMLLAEIARELKASRQSVSPLVCGMAERWGRSLAWGRPCGAQTEVGHGTTAADRQGVEARCASAWLRNGSVDIAPGCDCDRAHHGRALSPGPRMEGFGIHGLDTATARQTGTTTQ